LCKNEGRETGREEVERISDVERKVEWDGRVKETR